jgi:polyhydroxyalkanoate synthesis regulator phasin
VSILLGFFGCAQWVTRWQGEQDLREARHLMINGQYSASEKKNLSVLEASPQILGDEALFQMGVLYTLPSNVSYEKSRTFFERLVTQYPDSGRKEEATAWLLALATMTRYEREALETEKKLTIVEQALEARGKRLKQMQEELDARQKQMTERREALRQLQRRVTELEAQLANFKSIDLTVEQKKRATVP